MNVPCNAETQCVWMVLDIALVFIQPIRVFLDNFTSPKFMVALFVRRHKT